MILLLTQLSALEAERNARRSTIDLQLTSPQARNKPKILHTVVNTQFDWASGILLIDAIADHPSSRHEDLSVDNGQPYELTAVTDHIVVEQLSCYGIPGA